MNSLSAGIGSYNWGLQVFIFKTSKLTFPFPDYKLFYSDLKFCIVFEQDVNNIFQIYPSFGLPSVQTIGFSPINL